eukprot:2542339-Pyramimonas_sp.AAC.1
MGVHLKHSAVLEILPSLYPNADLQFAEDRITKAVVLLEDESGTFWMRNHEGVFPGDVGATLALARTFSPPVIEKIVDTYVGDLWYRAVE